MTQNTFNNIYTHYIHQFMTKPLLLKNYNLKISRLFLSILICQTAGLIGMLFKNEENDTWYNNIKKPETMPEGIFSPIWLVLYSTMGISFSLIWEKSLTGDKKARFWMYMFLIHLIPNALWYIFFFVLRNPIL